MNKFEEIKGTLYYEAKSMAYPDEQLDELVNEMFIDGRVLKCEPQLIRICARRAVLDYRRREKKTRAIEKSKDIANPVPMSRLSPEVLQNALSTPSTHEKEVENKEFSEKALKILEKTQESVVRSRLYKGRSFKEIGAEHGKTESWACMTFKGAIESLKGRYL
jgi:RNA polymerase sigma factor (sigma-70 family)